MTQARYRRLVQEWLGLQRCRALTLASLRDINEQIEDIRPELRDPPLAEPMPKICDRWIGRIIDQAIDDGLVCEDELVAA
jgi:hypothetical protein